MTDNNKKWENLEFVEVNDIMNNALAWKPGDPGDYIIGEYLKTEIGKGNGSGLIFHHLKDEDEQEVSILGSTVLNKKMENIEPGMIIKIEYKGKATTNNGRSYKNFAVYTTKQN